MEEKWLKGKMKRFEDKGKKNSTVFFLARYKYEKEKDLEDP